MRRQTALRARLLALGGIGLVSLGLGCGGSATRSPNRSPTHANAPAAQPASGSSAPATAPLALQLVLVDAGTERLVRWTPEMTLAFPDEHRGAFAYAQRKTMLHAVGRDTTIVGWLEPGARVGISAVTAERATVVLLPWIGSTASARAVAVVDARDLGPAPPASTPSTSAPAADAADVLTTRTIATGQWLRRMDDERFGYTHCGEVQILDQSERGVHVRQEQDGIVVEGLVNPRATWQTGPCPGRVLAEDQLGRTILYDRERDLPQPAGVAIPAGLVASGPLAGPTFATLVAKRTKLWWLVEDDTGTPSCLDWTLAASKTRPGEAELVRWTKLADGDTVVTTFRVEYTAEPETTVVVLGPVTGVMAPPGRQPHSGGVGMACGRDYRLVASGNGSFTMHRNVPSVVKHVIAYDTVDVERWYTDRARCEQDAAAKKQKLALAVTTHRDC